MDKTFVSQYRSDEHERKISLISAAACTAVSSSTTGIELMAEASASLRRILERIRDDTQEALKLLGDPEDVRSLRWKC